MMQALMNLLGVSSQAQVQPEMSMQCRTDKACLKGRAWVCYDDGTCENITDCCYV